MAEQEDHRGKNDELYSLNLVADAFVPIDH